MLKWFVMAIQSLCLSPFFKMGGVQFITRERICMVKVFIETQDAHETKITFQRRFLNRNPHSIRTIRHNHHKYLIHSTSTNRNKGISGRYCSARTPQNIASVWRDIQRNPSVSAMKNNVPVSKNTFNRITRTDLNFNPYRLHTHKLWKLGTHHEEMHFAFCQWLLGSSPQFVLHTSIMAEAAFFMNWKWNTWNMHKYAPKNNEPVLNYNIPNNRQKVMVWVGLTDHNTIIIKQ